MCQIKLYNISLKFVYLSIELYWIFSSRAITYSFLTKIFQKILYIYKIKLYIYKIVLINNFLLTLSLPFLLSGSCRPLFGKFLLLPATCKNKYA